MTRITHCWRLGPPPFDEGRLEGGFKPPFEGFDP